MADSRSPKERSDTPVNNKRKPNVFKFDSKDIDLSNNKMLARTKTKPNPAPSGLSTMKPISFTLANNRQTVSATTSAHSTVESKEAKTPQDFATGPQASDIGYYIWMAQRALRIAKSSPSEKYWSQMLRLRNLLGETQCDLLHQALLLEHKNKAAMKVKETGKSSAQFQSASITVTSNPEQSAANQSIRSSMYVKR